MGNNEQPYGEAQCWLSAAAAAERAALSDEELQEVVARHRAWRSYGEDKKLDRHQLREMRAQWYGYPPKPLLQRFTDFIGFLLASAGGIWLIWSVLVNLFPGGAAAWKMILTGAFTLALGASLIRRRRRFEIVTRR